MNKFIQLVGLPASGKSTLAQELALTENAVIHSSDALREELFSNVNENNNNEQLFKELHRRIKRDLYEGKNVIYDATNLNYKKRMAFLRDLKDLTVLKQCVLVATPYELCLEQNSLRERQVPEEVIKRMYKNINLPMKQEGWDSIEIKWNMGDMYFDLHSLFNGRDGLNKIDQETPFHTLTIGKHCLRTAQICEELMDDFELNVAALYHDIGKKFVKEYNEKKERYTYYQHHLVSAYDALFYLKTLEHEEESILNIVNYIQWHMMPFTLDSEKSREKFIRLLGESFFNKLMVLHEADIQAH